MSKEEFEAYLTLVSSLLQLTPEQREQIGDELHDHLENRVADLVDSGVDRQSAVLHAVEEFGDASALAENLKQVNSDNRKRWMMRFATLCTAASFLVAVFTMAMWPDDAKFGSPSRTIAQQDDTSDPFGDSPTVESPWAEPDAVDAATSDAPALSAATLTDQAIREKLKQACAFNYDETPVLELKEDLEERLGINVVLTCSATEDALIEDETVTSNLSGIARSNALRIMLAEKNATYCVKDGVIQIISLDEAGDKKWHVRKMVDVSETLAMIRETERSRIGKQKRYVINTGARGSGGGFWGMSGNSCVFEGVDADEVIEAKIEDDDLKKMTKAIIQAQAQAAEQIAAAKNTEEVTAESILLLAIQTSVAPREWAQTFGSATVTCVGGVLIVNAPEAVNDQVASFLEDLNFKIKNTKVSAK